MDIKDIKVGDRVLWSGEPRTVIYVGERIVVVHDINGAEHAVDHGYLTRIPAPPAPREPKCGDVVECFHAVGWIPCLVTRGPVGRRGFLAANMPYGMDEHGTTWRWPSEEK